MDAKQATGSGQPGSREYLLLASVISSFAAPVACFLLERERGSLGPVLPHRRWAHILLHLFGDEGRPLLEQLVRLREGCRRGGGALEPAGLYGVALGREEGQERLRV